MLCLYLSWIYNDSFDPFELPSWTAALIVFECGLMDVGLEIKEINPLRFCLIFKRHLTFLSYVSPLSCMSARERRESPWRLWLASGARARLRRRARVIFRTEISLALITERTHWDWMWCTYTQTLCLGRSVLAPFYSGESPSFTI